MNDLRDKARQGHQKEHKFDIPIRIWLKILESVIETIALYGCEVWGLLTNHDFTKWDKHQIETLHAEFCKNILRVQRRTPNNAYRTEFGHPLIIKIQKRAFKFYNHLKGSDSQTFHNKAITYREMNLEKSPLSKLVLGVCSQTQTHPHRAPGQQHN